MNGRGRLFISEVPERDDKHATSCMARLGVIVAPLFCGLLKGAGG